MNELQVYLYFVGTLVAVFLLFLFLCPDELSRLSFYAAGYVEASVFYGRELGKLLWKHGRRVIDCWKDFVRSLLQLHWALLGQIGLLLRDLRESAVLLAQQKQEQYAIKALTTQARPRQAYSGKEGD